MKSRAVYLLLVAAMAVSVFAPAAAAQTVTGTLSGRVTDASGGVIPNAPVSAKSEQTGFVREVRTNDEGYYLLTFLQVGTYTVTVELQGFKTITKKGVSVELNKNTVSDFKLEPAAITSVVEVTGETPQIETTVGEIKHSLDTRTVESIPLAGRNIISLSEQIPGFQNVQWIGSSNNPTNSTGSYAAFSGTGSRNATFQIDGVNNDDSSENQNRQNVNISSIKEVQVLTNAYSAEFGRAGGAVFLVQTKSGTNQFHGEAYDYIQNDKFNANGYFANRAGINTTTGQPLQPRQRVRRNQYGWTVGGPILHDRLFFFHSGERVSNYTNSTITRFKYFTNELTARACGAGETNRPGRALEPLGNLCLDPAFHPNMAADLAFVQSVLDLFKNPLIDGTTPNDPAACSDMVLSGRPNRCVTLSGSNKLPDSDYTGKLDWNPWTGTVVALRYQYSRQIRNSFRIITGDNFGTNNNRQYNIGANVTHVFSNRQTGEFRFGFGNRTTLQDVTDGNHIPVIRFATTLSPSGTVIGTSTNVPINRRQHDQQYVYNHTYVLNKHTFRGGTDIRFQLLDDLTGDRARGFWTFSTFDALGNAFNSTPSLTDDPACGSVRYPFVPGDTIPAGVNCAPNTATTPPTSPAGFTGWENLLRGFVTGYQQGYGNPIAENRFSEFNLYVQDDWRIFRTLTLNLGFRWEGVRAPEEKEDRFSYGYDDDFNNFEPRIGFAWTPTVPEKIQWLFGKPGDFVVRGGYGIYHSRIFQSIFSQNQLSIRTQPPNGFATAFTLGSVSNPFCNYQVSSPAFTDAPTCATPFVFTPGDPNLGRSTADPCSLTTGGCGLAGEGVKVLGGQFLGTLLIPDPGLQNPYTQQWNFTLERTLPWKMALQVSYNGNRGIGLPFYDSDNDAVFGITSPLVTVDVGGGNFQPVVFDLVCTDFTVAICNNNGSLTGFNQATSGSLRSFSSLTSATATLAQKGIVVIGGVPHGYISLNTTRVNERRPDPTMRRNVLLRNFAWSYYQAVTFKLTKRLSDGLSFNAFWTISKTFDTGSEATFTGVDSNAPSGQINPARSLRGLSNYDTRHRVVLTYAYDLPWHRAQQGWVGRVLGGWTISGTTTMQSGNPFTITAGYDVNLDGLGGDRPFIVDPSVMWKHLDNGNSFALNGCPSTPVAGVCQSTLSELLVPVSAFNPGVTSLSNGSIIPLLAGQNGEGTIPRNTFFGDGMIVFDTAFAKNVKIRESMSLELRMEFYNLFNHVTFELPSSRTAVSTSLGRITAQRNPANFVNSARDNGSRMGQLALRFRF